MNDLEIVKPFSGQHVFFRSLWCLIKVVEDVELKVAKNYWWVRPCSFNLWSTSISSCFNCWISLKSWVHNEPPSSLKDRVPLRTNSDSLTPIAIELKINTYLRGNVCFSCGLCACSGALIIFISAYTGGISLAVLIFIVVIAIWLCDEMGWSIS